MKKSLCFILSILMVLLTITPVMASENIKVMVYDKEVTFDVPPEINNNRTMVPLRAIFEALGATVEWDAKNQKIEAYKNERNVELQLGSSEMIVENETIYLDAPAYVKDNRTLVPARAIAEAFGNKVTWEAETNTVYIDYITDVLKINHEYGPMTLNSIYGDTIYSTTQISSLIFTKCERNGSKEGYTVEMNVKGISNDRNYIYVYFYDENDIVLEQACFMPAMPENVEFNSKDAIGISKTVLENAKRIAFYSTSGHPANYVPQNAEENVSVPTNNPTTTTTTTNKESTVCEHDIVVTEGREATCTSSGKTDKKQCKLCREVIQYSETIEALGHNYKNGQCTRCDEWDPGYREEFEMGDTWTVPDNLKFTVTSVDIHHECNSRYGKSGAAVVLINYEYSNIGYYSTTVSSDELYISSLDFDVYDGDGEAASLYPCTHQTYAKTLTNGKKCSASIAYVLVNDSDEITLNIERFVNRDGKMQRAKAEFILSLDNYDDEEEYVEEEYVEEDEDYDYEDESDINGAKQLVDYILENGTKKGVGYYISREKEKEGITYTSEIRYTPSSGNLEFLENAIAETEDFLIGASFSLDPDTQTVNGDKISLSYLDSQHTSTFYANAAFDAETVELDTEFDYNVELSLNPPSNVYDIFDSTILSGLANWILLIREAGLTPEDVGFLSL